MPRFPFLARGVEMRCCGTHYCCRHEGMRCSVYLCAQNTGNALGIVGRRVCARTSRDSVLQSLPNLGGQG